MWNQNAVLKASFLYKTESEWILLHIGVQEKFVRKKKAVWTNRNKFCFTHSKDRIVLHWYCIFWPWCLDEFVQCVQCSVYSRWSSPKQSTVYRENFAPFYFRPFRPLALANLKLVQLNHIQMTMPENWRVSEFKTGRIVQS